MHDFIFHPPAREDFEGLKSLAMERPEMNVYLVSRIEKALKGNPDGRTWVLKKDGNEIVGGVYIGDDANLAVTTMPAGALELFKTFLLENARGVQVVVSPRKEVDAVVEAFSTETGIALNRVQALYGAWRGDPIGPGARELEPATMDDFKGLHKASIGLALEDLGIPRWALDTSRTMRNVKKKIRKKRTFVLKLRGKLAFKVDIAFRTERGAMIEGVYTFPEYRGKGLASMGCAELTRRLLEEKEFVVLHVGEKNIPARRAYEKAGMKELGELGLAIFKPWI